MHINSWKIMLLTGFLITAGTALPGDNPQYYGFYHNSETSGSELSSSEASDPQLSDSETSDSDLATFL